MSQEDLEKAKQAHKESIIGSDLWDPAESFEAGIKWAIENIYQKSPIWKTGLPKESGWYIVRDKDGYVAKKFYDHLNKTWDIIPVHEDFWIPLDSDKLIYFTEEELGVIRHGISLVEDGDYTSKEERSLVYEIEDKLDKL